jgi:hypothetical protein
VVLNISWLGPFIRLLEKLGLRSPLFISFAIVSGYLEFAPDSWLPWQLIAPRETYFVWIALVFYPSIAIAFAFALDWSWSAVRRRLDARSIRRSRVDLLNGLDTLEHQVIENHFRANGLRENTVIITATSTEHDVLIKLRGKGIVTVAPMRLGAPDWRAVPYSVTIAPWAWEIMNSDEYKPNLTGTQKRR